MEIKCPFCNNFKNKVIDTRPTNNKQNVRRRRVCLICGKRFTTLELPITENLNSQFIHKCDKIRTQGIVSKLNAQREALSKKLSADAIKNEILKILEFEDRDILKRGGKWFALLIERIIELDPFIVGNILRKYKILPSPSFEESKLQELFGHFLPKNEMGTLLIFIKYINNWYSDIIEIRKDYPDLILLDKSGLKKVLAEIEYKSSNFKQHKHDPKGCDLVICWQHNCKLPIPVLELKTKHLFNANEN